MTSIQLVRGRWIFTDEDTLFDGAIAFQDDTILEVGSWESLKTKYRDAKVHGSRQFAILPGLINAHHHSNGIPNSLQGIDDDFLELWLFANSASRPQDPTLKTLWSAASLLRSGVTTVLDVASISGTPEACIDNLKGRLNAYEQAGLRVALAPGANYSSFLVHFEDDTFLASLPDSLRQKAKALIPLQEILSPENYLSIISDLVVSYQAHPHIDVWFGPPGPQWVGDALMVRIAEAAASLNTGIQTHVVESFYEKLMGPRFYGKSVVAHLQELGVLSPRFSMAHGVWLTETDIEILAATGASISHNPSSNLRLRAGIAPLNVLLQAGVTVGLGMDGTTLGDDEDMFAEMRLAARLHRTPLIDTPAPTFADIFRMATTGGARLLRQQQKIGKLAPGYRADLVLVKCDRITSPWVAPEANPLHVVLMRARAADVDTVFVNGKVVLQEGQPTGFNLQAVEEEIVNQMNATSSRENNQAFVAELYPYLKQWYASWKIPEIKPYAAFNSQI